TRCSCEPSCRFSIWKSGTPFISRVGTGFWKTPFRKFGEASMRRRRSSAEPRRFASGEPGLRGSLLPAQHGPAVAEILVLVHRVGSPRLRERLRDRVVRPRV